MNTTGSAAKLTTPRTISATGDGTWSVSFDGSTNTTAALTLAATGVTAGTYSQVTVDAKGRVTAGSNATKTYNTTISGTATVTHNLGSRNVDVVMYDTTTLYKIDGRIKLTDPNKIDIEFDSALPNTVSVTVTRKDI